MGSELVLRAEMTLAELASQHPNTIPWLLQNHWDFYCGGAHDLKWACQTHEWEFEAFCQSLKKALQKPVGQDELHYHRWEPHQIGELLDHLGQRYHEPHRDKFRQMTPLLNQAVEAHGESHRFLSDLKETVGALIADLQTHMGHEEQKLFPTIRSYSPDFQGERSLLGRQDSLLMMETMRGVHEKAGLLIEKVRWLTDGFTPQVKGDLILGALYPILEAFHRELRVHVHLENNILFPYFENMELSMS